MFILVRVNTAGMPDHVVSSLEEKGLCRTLDYLLNNYEPAKSEKYLAPVLEWKDDKLAVTTS